MRLHYWTVSLLARTAFRIGYGLRVAGLENIPRSGAVILASNHRSNFDPPLLGGIVPREVHFFAKEELFRKPISGRFLKSLNAFPVRRGQMDRRALARCKQILADEEALVFFPEGTRAPEDGFLKAKLGVGWLLCQTRAPVLPVYIHGSAVDGVRLRGRPAIRMVFGKPVAGSILLEGLPENRDAYQAAADRILELIRELSLSTPDGKVSSKGPIYDREVIEDERLR